MSRVEEKAKQWSFSKRDALIVVGGFLLGCGTVDDSIGGATVFYVGLALLGVAAYR
jgi:hypothetical protein